MFVVIYVGSKFYTAVLCYRYGGGDYQWTVTLFVGKSEEAIRKVHKLPICTLNIYNNQLQYIYSNVGGAQRYNSVATFHFIQPEGVLLLHPLTDDVPVGWTVCLHQSPMKVCLLHIFSVITVLHTDTTECCG